MSTLPAEPPAEEESIDEVEAALAWPGGDARAAIADVDVITVDDRCPANDRIIWVGG